MDPFEGSYIEADTKGKSVIVEKLKNNQSFITVQSFRGLPVCLHCIMY
jgi:hypothetical protein